MKTLHSRIIIIILMAFFTGQLAQAQVLNSCDQWANYCSAGYCVYNNLWGDNAGPQCITAQSTTQWTVRSTQSGTGVKTYPNSSREMAGENVTVGSLSTCTSSMNVSGPGTGDYCTAWDIWCPEEVMIWMNKYGNVSPWGSFVETATIGGVTWDVYKNGYPGFVRQSNTNSMTVDIKAILDYCVGKGWLSNSGVIEKIQGGFEITSTGGQERTFTMNSYSVSFSTGGSVTPVPTQTPTPTSNRGDVNEDGNIDIVDALLVAQYYVGLNPGNFNSANADTDCDGDIDIVDALLIAQYYVGLITGFC